MTSKLTRIVLDAVSEKSKSNLMKLERPIDALLEKMGLRHTQGGSYTTDGKKPDELAPSQMYRSCFCFYTNGHDLTLIENLHFTDEHHPAHTITLDFFDNMQHDDFTKIRSKIIDFYVANLGYELRGGTSFDI